jgi:hypothetical protein
MRARACHSSDRMDEFGRGSSREMPAFLFRGALRVDHASAVRADTSRQNCSVCPRYWYVDATFRCGRCGAEFVFSTDEQRVWYEHYEFWIESLPRHCQTCRADLRQVKAARREYDRMVPALSSQDGAGLARLAAVIDELYELGGELPPRINETRRRVANRLSKDPRAGASE